MYTVGARYTVSNRHSQEHRNTEENPAQNNKVAGLFLGYAAELNIRF